MNSYLNDSLVNGERIFKKADFSKALFIGPIVVTFFLFVFLTIFASVYGLLLALLIGAVLIVSTILLRKSNCLAVTNLKVFGKTGIIHTNEMSSPLKHIQDIRVESDASGKLFKYGTVVITTASGEYSFNFVKKPSEFRNAVLRQIEMSEEDKMDIHARKIADAFKENY